MSEAAAVLCRACGSPLVDHVWGPMVVDGRPEEVICGVQVGYAVRHTRRKLSATVAMTGSDCLAEK